MVLDKEDGKWAGPGRGDGGGRERAVRGLTRGPGRPPPAGYRRGFAGLGASRPLVTAKTAHIVASSATAASTPRTRVIGPPPPAR